MPQPLVSPSSPKAQSRRQSRLLTPPSRLKPCKTMQSNCFTQRKSSARGKFKTSHHTLLAMKTTNTLVRSRECMGAGKTDYGVQYLPHKLVNLRSSPRVQVKAQDCSEIPARPTGAGKGDGELIKECIQRQPLASVSTQTIQCTCSHTQRERRRGRQHFPFIFRPSAIHPFPSLLAPFSLRVKY